jgi:hypothetical protein
MPSWTALAKSRASRSRARKQPAARRFPLRNSALVRMMIRKMGTSDVAGAAAPVCAADTSIRPILPTQSAQCISCTGSKDTCTSQTSRLSDNRRRRSHGVERNQKADRPAGELILAFPHFTVLLIPFNTVEYLGRGARSRTLETRPIRLEGGPTRKSRDATKSNWWG